MSKSYTPCYYVDYTDLTFISSLQELHKNCMHIFVQSPNFFECDTVFCIWFGTDVMPVNRATALLSILSNINAPVQLVNSRNFAQWVLPDYPLHPAFEFLTDTHKSDYLRVYLMYHYGGGYTDIKFTFKDWSEAFRALRSSNKQFLGYRELSPSAVCLNQVERLNPDIVPQLRASYHVFPGTSAFIFKKQTPFAGELLTQMRAILDDKLEALKKNPGRYPQEYFGAQLADKSISKYPLEWTELLGDNFHPLAFFNHLDDVLYHDIKPSGRYYREYL